MATAVERLKEHRLARMRLGQAFGVTESLPSQPEFKISLVPLTEAENLQCVDIVTNMDVPDSIAGAQSRDRRNQVEILFRSIRDPDNVEERMFESVEEMTELLEIVDINYLFDSFLVMSESVNPLPGQYEDEEVDEIKKALEEVAWKELSGRQWFALSRFLSTVGKELHPASLPGSISTNSLTTMNGE